MTTTALPAQRPSSTVAAAAAEVGADTSITLVSGALSRPAELRALPSGDSLVVIELTTRRSDGPAESIPVVWPTAPAWAAELEAGARVVVIGRVRRRFFRAGGATASRTELVAERIVPERQRARVRSAVELVHERADELVAPTGQQSR